jgi:hypothetical protein
MSKAVYRGIAYGPMLQNKSMQIGITKLIALAKNVKVAK